MSDSFDSFDLDLDDVDTDKMGGFNSPAPGKYHGQVNGKGYGMPHWDNCFWFDVEVLAGTRPGQEGKVQRFGFDYPATVDASRSGVCKSKMLAFAIAVGLTTQEEVNEAKKGGRRLRIDWNLAVGRQLCFEVEVNEKRKSGTAVKEWAYWPLSSSKCAGIPMLQGAGGVGQSGQSGSQGGNGAASAPFSVPSDAPAETLDPFAGII